MHIRKQRLLTPGPTPLLPKALHAMMGSDIHHRTEDFRNVYRQVLADLKEVMGTANDVLTLAASGTGAMEASVSNFFSRGDRVIVCSAGKFGERWVEIVKAYGLDAIVLSAEYGSAVSANAVADALRMNPGVKGVFVQASETSTGAAHDVKGMASAIRKTDAIFVADAITGLGTMPLDIDGWGIDVVVAGSQKSFMIPPGLAFLSISPKATMLKERDEINTLGFTTDIFSQFSKSWTANTGIEIYSDKIGSARKEINTQTAAVTAKRGLYPDNSTYGNYSLYSLHRLQYGKWMMEGGLRFNLFNIQINDTTLGKIKINPSALVANAALMYAINANQTIYATFSSGFRAPNIDDMGTLGIVDFRYEIPASGLKPERSQHTELGYKLQTRNFGATIAAWYMNLSDIITRVKFNGQVINGYQVYKKENTEKAYIKGFDAEVRWTIIKQLNINGGLSYAYGQSLSKHEPLRRIPPFNGRLMSTYRNKRFFAAAELQFASSQTRLAQGDKDDNRIPAGGTPGWQVINLYAGYKISVFQFNTGLQNLLNENYRTHGSGINSVGRSGWLSVIVKI